MELPFLAYYAVEFVFWIMEGAADGSTAVVVMAYQFCEVFGKEELAEFWRKHRRLACVLFFMAPFGKENYVSYLEWMYKDK